MKKINELLVRLSSQSGHDRTRIRELLQPAPSWPALAALAKHHECGPMVYHSLHSLGLEQSADPAFLEQVKTYYFSNLRRNMAFETEIAGLLAACGRENLDILAFKGFALLYTLYTDPGLRIMTDVDILVPEGRRADGQEILARRGWRQCSDPTEPGELVYLKESAGHRIILELHERLFPARPHPVNLPVWQRATGVSVGKSRMLAPSPEDSLLIACIHIRRHTRRLNLKFCVDINELLRSGKTLDWDYIAGQAAANKVVNCVRLGLGLVKGLFGTGVKVPPALSPFPAASGMLRPDSFFAGSWWRGYWLRAMLFDSFTDACRYGLDTIRKKR